jgi:hypothetical protein
MKSHQQYKFYYIYTNYIIDKINWKEFNVILCLKNGSSS